jgi:hypothetical protein
VEALFGEHDQARRADGEEEIMIANGDERVERYLRTLKRELRGLGTDETADIVAELRSHVAERVDEGASVDDVLARLGRAEELAGRYLADHVLASAEVSRSPLGVLHGVFRWATLSAAGSAVLLVAIAGYFAGAALLLCAALKPFHPQTAGLWTFPDGAGATEVSLRMGFGTLPAHATDVLGWWIVPIGLAAGTMLIVVTTSFALWCVRHARAARVLPV